MMRLSPTGRARLACKRLAVAPFVRGLLGVAFLAACATDNGGTEEDLGDLGPVGGLNRGELPVSVRYQRTAEGNWLKGNEAFEDGEYLAAQRYFQYIRTKFPYSRFAAMAEVRIADCLYERERYLEAIDAYQGFVRTRPTHKQVPYALYRVGLGYYEQIPGNFFLLPPAHEKDQAAVRDAERKLREYVRRFPKDEYYPEAKAKLDDVRKRLMAHERYVADFYENLDRTRAYVGRLEVIRKDFADVGLDDELLLEIIEAWAEVGEIEKAKNAQAQLKKEFPASDLLKDARVAIRRAEAAAALEQDDGGQGDAPATVRSDAEPSTPVDPEDG